MRYTELNTLVEWVSNHPTLDLNTISLECAIKAYSKR